MAARSFFCFLTMLLVGSVARAELYQFTINRHVLWSIPSQPQAGDPVIIRYIADTIDKFPEDPLYGEYPCFDHEIEFPHDTFQAFNPDSTTLYVVRGQVGDGIAVSGAVATSTVFYFSRMGLGFPPNTLTNDSLPLSIDFQTVNFARSELHTHPNVKVAWR